MPALITPDDLEEWQRQIDEQREAEATRKPAKDFRHREPPPSKCPSCKLAVTRWQKRICEASGMPVIETSGVGQCAYLPIKKAYDD